MISFAPLDEAGRQVVEARVAEREQAVDNKLREEYSARRGRLRQTARQALLEDLRTLTLVWQVLAPDDVATAEARERFDELSFSELARRQLYYESLVHPRVEGEWHALEIQAALTARDATGTPLFTDVRQLLRLPAIVRRFLVERLLAARAKEPNSAPAREPAVVELTK